MSLVATAAVTALGATCAFGTVWLARRAEQAAAPPDTPGPGSSVAGSGASAVVSGATVGGSAAVSGGTDAGGAPEAPWWESAPWWASLSDDEKRWVVRNLTEAGHAPGADLD